MEPIVIDISSLVYYVITYFVVLFISIFVVLPYLVAKHNFKDDIGSYIFFCFCWPATYFCAIGYYLLKWIGVTFRTVIINPFQWVFDKIVKFHTPKPVVKKIVTEPVKPEVDQTKTGYRNVEFKK